MSAIITQSPGFAADLKTADVRQYGDNALAHHDGAATA